MDWGNTINSIEGNAVCAMDLNYHLKATEFLNYFNLSADTKNGLDMLIHQALMSLDIWYNKNLSLSIDVDDLKKDLMGRYDEK
jgi:shikimate 5-dehydrogenase